MRGPYYRSARSHWAVRINGYQRVLVKGPKNKATEAQAWAEYQRLMTQGTNAKGTVKELLNAYWASAEQARKIGELADSTLERRRPVLMLFGQRCGRLKVVNLKPHDVETWLNQAYPECGPTTLNTRIGWIKRVFSWGVEVGLCDRSPIAGMKRPTPRVRQEFIEPSRWPEMLADCSPLELRDVVEFMLYSTCRVQELYRLEAQYHKPGKFVLPMRESKGKQRSRVVRYPSSLIPLVKRLVAEHPNGPIFCNSRGNAWNKDSLNGALRRLRKRLGWPVLNGTMLRHSACHARLVAGQDSHLVQKLMGHTSGRMIEQRYGHIERNHEVMEEAANHPLGVPPPHEQSDVAGIVPGQLA